MMVHGSVFEVIRELALRFHRDSRPLPAQTDFMPLAAALCFTVMDAQLAIPLEELSEVHELPPYTRLPRVKPWMLGIAAIRGKLVPIVDLAKFLGGERRTTTKNQRVLVIALQGSFVGVLVDGVVGVRQLETEQFREHVIGAPARLEPYIQGCFVDSDGREIYLFRPLQLIEDELFQDVAV